MWHFWHFDLPPEALTNVRSPLVEEPVAVLALLLGILAILFGLARHPVAGKVFKVVPLLIFAYFVPTLLSNTGVIPLDSALYGFVQKHLLPASLLLLTLSVDIPGILRLGPKALYLFLGATASIVFGGPLAYLALGWLVPEEIRDQAWRGLAALSGSWIGGGANMIAIQKNAQASDAIMGLIVVVDVAVANVWMAFLLYFAGRDRELDARIGAERRALDDLRQRMAEYRSSVSRPTSLADLLILCAIAIGGAVIATEVSGLLVPRFPDALREMVGGFTLTIILVTTAGVALSFTPARRLEGAGASAVGSVFLYLLVTTIGAKGNFLTVAEGWQLLLVGALWMLFHAVFLLLLRRWLRAPIFFLAVGSKANVGGAASAPVVAGAFDPALAPVGGLLAVGGYVLGTYGGIACQMLLQLVHGLYD